MTSPPPHPRLLTVAALCAAALGSSACGAPSDAVGPACDPGVDVDGVTVGAWADPFTHESLMEFSAFFEILEVRASPHDDLLFMCTGVHGLMMVDAADPQALQPLWTLKGDLGHGTYPRCQHLAVEPDRLYFTNRGDEIQPTPFVAAYSNDPLSPTQLGVYTEEGRSFEGVASDGERAYVAMHADGVRVLEWAEDELVAGPLIGGLGFAYGLAVHGEYLFVADGAAGLKVVDRASLEVVGAAAFAGTARSVEIDPDTDTAWVAAGDAGLVGVDMSDPAAPQVVGVADTPGLSLQVSLGAGHAYVADWNDLRIFDVSDPTSPTLVAAETLTTVAPFPRVLGVGTRDDLAFIGEWTGMYVGRLHPGVQAPELRVDPGDLDFGRVEPQATRSRELTVVNDGQADLVVCRVEIEEGSPYVVEPSSLALAPGESATLTVTFSPVDAAPAHATLTLVSDDPDQPALTVALGGNESGLDVGDPAPEVVIDLTDGGQWQLSDHTDSVVVLAYFATF